MEEEKKDLEDEVTKEKNLKKNNLIWEIICWSMVVEAPHQKPLPIRRKNSQTLNIRKRPRAIDLFYLSTKIPLPAILNYSFKNSF